MRTVKGYQDFITEKFIDDPEYTIKKFFVELEKNIRYWFDEGSLSSDTVLYDITMETTNNVDKYLRFDFQDEEYYYQVVFVLTLDDVEENKLGECHIEVKRYDVDSGELLRQISDDVEVKDITEDKIIDLIAKLDEASSELGEDETGGETLPDEETELEDTDIF